MEYPIVYTRIEVILLQMFQSNQVLKTFEYSDKGKEEAKKYIEEIKQYLEKGQNVWWTPKN